MTYVKTPQRKDIKRGMLFLDNRNNYRELTSYNKTYAKLDWDKPDQKVFYMLDEFHSMLDSRTFIPVTSEAVIKRYFRGKLEEQLKELKEQTEKKVAKLVADYDAQFSHMSLMELQGTHIDGLADQFAVLGGWIKDMLIEKPTKGKYLTYQQRIRKALGYNTP